MKRHSSEKGSALLAVLVLVFTGGLITALMMAIGNSGTFEVASHVEQQRSMFTAEGKLEEVESCWCLRSPADYRPEMTREELRIKDDLNYGTTWYESVQPAAEKLSHLCICHAIHDLSCHKPYSIPDILRMNDFCVEVKVSHQHWEEQDGCSRKWWERCSFEEFRGKFVRK